jgi:hypothetical protein
LCIGGVLEGVENLLEGHNALGLFVNSLPDHSIGPFAQLLQYLELA